MIFYDWRVGECSDFAIVLSLLYIIVGWGKNQSMRK